jgi:hypothetical protein
MLSLGFLTLIVLSIIVVSLMLAIMKNLKRISERAEVATSNVANIAETLGSKIAPLAASGILTMVMKRFSGKRKSKDE